MIESRGARSLLAIDTSTEQAGIGLFDGERVAELSWMAGRSQTTSVLAQIHHLLTLHEVVVSDVAAIAVAIGPGSFNGLRVGISVAKGLVLGLGVPLLGVSSLAAAALPYAAVGRRVVPVVSAGRGRLIWAEYQDNASGWDLMVAPRNGTAEELAISLRGPVEAIVVGEMTTDQERVVATGASAILVERPLRARRPAAVAALAWSRLVAGDVDDPVTLEPVYLGRG